MHELDSLFARYNDLQNEIDILCSNDEDIKTEERYRADIENIYFSPSRYGLVSARMTWNELLLKIAIQRLI